MSGNHPEPHYRPNAHHRNPASHDHAHVQPGYEHPSPHHHPPKRRNLTWLWLLLAACALAALGFVGWRTYDSRTTKPAEKAVTGSVKVYFASGEKYHGVERPVHEGETDVEAAMVGLMAGPTAAEIKDGLNTHIPYGTTVESVQIAKGEDKGAKEHATINLSETFVEETSRDSGEAKREYEARLDQVSYTMEQFKQIGSSEVKSDGKTLPVPTVAQVEKPSQPEPAVVDPGSSAAKASDAGTAASKPSNTPVAPAGATMSITAIQHKLVDLKYLPPEGVTSKNDYRTQQAIMAFQAWQGLQRDGTAGPKTIEALGTATAPVPKVVSGSSGRQAQVYRDKGVTLFVEDGKLIRAVHVSTGKPGYATPAGTFAIYQKELKHWSTQYSCWLPYASFFTGGYAFHQYEDIPPYPGSHGCCRVPVPEAPWVYQFLVMDTPVHVY